MRYNLVMQAQNGLQAQPGGAPGDFRSIEMRKTVARSEDAPAYTVNKNRQDDNIISQALSILAGRMYSTSDVFNSPQDVKHYLMLRIGGKDHEVFAVLFLDAQHRLILAEEMFRGTLTQTSVYPREVVKASIQNNAAAVVLAHNHPSGNVTPSHADKALTQTLKSALALVDVRVLDHIVVSAASSYSFAETGLI